ncbi:hypothetical protein D3C87_1324810 [compost metagenome]
MAGTVEETVERTEQPATEDLVEHFGEAVFRCVMAFQQHGGQCWRQGQRVERRNHGRDCNGQGELLVELPGEAGDKRCRNKHRTQHERRRDDRAGHFTHRPFGCFDRCQSEFDVPFDVLHHHDGVVHYDTDCQHQAEQRERVE